MGDGNKNAKKKFGSKKGGMKMEALPSPSAIR